MVGFLLSGERAGNADNPVRCGRDVAVVRFPASHSHTAPWSDPGYAFLCRLESNSVWRWGSPALDRRRSVDKARSPTTNQSVRPQGGAASRGPAVTKRCPHSAPRLRTVLDTSTSDPELSVQTLKGFVTRASYIYRNNFNKWRLWNSRRNEEYLSI